jgi:hypothetical protein
MRHLIEQLVSMKDEIECDEVSIHVTKDSVILKAIYENHHVRRETLLNDVSVMVCPDCIRTHFVRHSSISFHS